MLPAIESPYLVPYDGNFRINKASTSPPKKEKGKKKNKARLVTCRERLYDLQRQLYASDNHALLLIFQAMDAAGKDSTIRNVFSGVNPAGFRVSSFKKPSTEELGHDFLWRTVRRLPERGRIGIFNRSYYEEVLVVKVHPELLDYQRLPEDVRSDNLWAERYESIRDHERHLARSGTRILKFFLHVSKEEQRQRFLSRLDEVHKNWKFSAADVRERGFWDSYQKTYEEALNATSRPWAPWYAIPADDKPYMRATVAELVQQALEGLNLQWPEVQDEERVRFDEMRRFLESEG